LFHIYYEIQSTIPSPKRNPINSYKTCCKLTIIYEDDNERRMNNNNVTTSMMSDTK